MLKRDRLSIIIVTVLTAGVIYFLTRELRGRGKQLEEALKHLDWRWLVGGLLMMIVSIAFEAAATRVLLN